MWMWTGFNIIMESERAGRMRERKWMPPIKELPVLKSQAIKISHGFRLICRRAN
jgi:hypothetical protein